MNNKRKSSKKQQDAEEMTLRQWYKGLLAPVVYRGLRETHSAIGNDAIAKYTGELADALITEDEQFEKGGKL